ncbi:MAG: hypothetical protein ACRDZZ_08285 [Ilumatobacteraceae bacterium]
MLVAALALVGAACGGDDDASTDDAAESDSGDTGDNGDGGDDGGSGGGEFCDLARGVEEGEDLLEGVDFSDPDAIEDAYRTMIDRINDASDSAPDEIRDDIELVIDRSEAVFEALEDADFNILDVDQSVLEDPEAEAASERIDAYLDNECGITTDSDDSDDTDDSDDSGDTGDTGDTGDVEGTIRDQLLTQFTAMGMTEDQANCLVDNIDFAEVAEGNVDDPTAFFELFETCDIDITQLQPGS